MSVVMGLVVVVLFFQLISPLKINEVGLDPKLDELLFVNISLLVRNVLDGINVRNQLGETGIITNERYQEREKRTKSWPKI